MALKRYREGVICLSRFTCSGCPATHPWLDDDGSETLTMRLQLNDPALVKTYKSVSLYKHDRARVARLIFWVFSGYINYVLIDGKQMGSQVGLSIVESEFLSDVPPVGFDGSFGNAQHLRDVLGGLSLAEQIGNLDFRRGQEHVF